MVEDIQEVARCRGRALLIGREGRLYIGRRYAILRSDDRGRSWQLDCAVRAPAWRNTVTVSRLAARLLRHEIAALVMLSDGTRVAIARDGIHRAGAGEIEMTRGFAIRRGSRPLNVAVGENDRVLFGEYGDNPQRHEMHVYVSDVGARHFEVAYTFRAGDVRHIHNVYWDAGLAKYWVLVGDYDAEPGIGLLERDLSRIEWVVRGPQQCRVVAALIEPDALLFGTDSDTEQNHIVRLEKSTGRMTNLCDIPGTSLHATRVGEWRAISTCVEPSAVNTGRVAMLFVSRDGERWEAAASYPKDTWDFRFFQYGTLILPYASDAGDVAMYSGQAVQGLDGKTRILDLRVAG